MRLLNERTRRVTTLALMLAVAGCGVLGGAERPLAGQGDSSVAQVTDLSGPSADYPVVLGDPFTIDGIEHSPDDALNYDEVGYATLDTGAGITASHRTLPLPSYAEVTSLETGKTVLVRVERRGPMSNSRLLALSAGAQAQLEASEGSPIRIRRVNPPEVERAVLRAGQAAPGRLATPTALVEVLKRKLPAIGSASLNRSPTDAPSMAAAEQARTERPDVADVLTATVVARSSDLELKPLADAAPTLPSRNQLAVSVTTPKQVAELTAGPSAPAITGKPNPATLTDGFVVQAAAFSSEANAKRAAGTLEGFVVKAGKFYRVRTGPYETRGQANAALAKVKAAGYSDATVHDAG